MIASVLRLSRADIKALKVHDAYSLHRVIYGLFDDVRSDAEKNASNASGILYADKGGDFNTRQILLLSNRQPNTPEHGEVESRTIPDNFLEHDTYRFEVNVNPTRRDKGSGKTVPVKGRDAIHQWFNQNASKSWGFVVQPESLQINHTGVKTFEKKGNLVTLNSATLQGVLTVSNRLQFINSFQKGIGRGRAFGFGLLQIVPANNPFNI